MMPQASDELRHVMELWFGDAIDDGGPLRFLEARGWTFPGGLCIPPVPSHNPSQYELTCIEFLHDEWDYGYEGVPDRIRPLMESE